MKINQLQYSKSLCLEKTFKRKKSEPGFALVATISVMVLLVMIALAMLSLSTLETRSAVASDAREEARANARMALMLAIGELQKYAGPDQRVTAEADILSNTGFHGKDRNSDRKHYLGVYSTEEWHERDNSGLRGSWKKYDKDRNKDAFQRWLVSGMDDERVMLEFAEQAVDPDQSIEVVGEGTVGDDDPDDLVRVPFDELTDDRGKTTGRLAWWVGDQGVKARVDLADLRRDTSNMDRTNKSNRVNPTQMGMENVTGFENIGMDPTDEEQQESLKRVLSFAQTGFLNNGAVAEEDLKKRYHDVTTYSRGVLADVARGGLKRDLSLPFELPHLPAEDGAADRGYALNRSDLPQDRDSSYTEMYEFSNSGDRRSEWLSTYWPNNFRPEWWAKRVGYVFGYPAGSGTDEIGMRKYLRGATWDMLRNHYRLYKREYETLDRSDPDRQNVKAPGDQRTWLARPYTPYSYLTGSLGQTVLSRTYVSEFGGNSVNAKANYSMLDPFFTYGNAIAHGNRWWGTKHHNTLGLNPIVTRVTLVFGVYGLNKNEDGDFERTHFTVDAVGTLWNPYNVPIQAEAIFADVNISGMELLFKDALNRTYNLSNDLKRVRIGVTEEHPAGHDFHSSPGIKYPLRLNPGEIRTFTLNFPEPKRYSGNIAPGSFVQNAWTGGYFLEKNVDPKTGRGKFKTNTQFTVRPFFKPNATLGSIGDRRDLGMQTHLGYFHLTNGTFRSPFEVGNLQDLPHISGMVTNKAGNISQIQKTITIRQGKEQKSPFLKLEYKLKAADELHVGNNGIAREFDPRAIVSHSKVQGGETPENWEITMESITDWSDIQSGDGSSRNHGFWGPSHEGGGKAHVIYYEVPDSPLASIASFQHCQTSPAIWDQPYAIGGSHAPKKLDHDKIYRTEDSDGFENVYYDNAYLLNTALWDRYYFSGLTLDDLSLTPEKSLEAAEAVMERFLDSDKENPLNNRRLSLGGHTGGQPPIEEMTHYRWLARHLMLDGAFNINSTRVEAWKAWLSSLKGSEMDVVNPNSGETSKESTTDTPFSRMTVAGDKEGTEWRGYVNLTDAEIANLAENIVKEVRKRGPFLSLADFINRRITTDKTGEEGALQAALRESSLVDNDVQEGISGNLRQGDILSGLGASITARSDTFVVRAYGDSLDAKGNVLARAWCEAVVQRIPTPVGDTGVLLDVTNPDFDSDDMPLGDDPSRTDDYVLNPAASEGAKKYGRQFRVISFRWLAKDEV